LLLALGIAVCSMLHLLVQFLDDFIASLVMTSDGVHFELGCVSQ
jgi:hypothetical protein